MTAHPAVHQGVQLVEGHAEIEQALRKILEPRGSEILQARGGEDALEHGGLLQFGFDRHGGHTSGRGTVAHASEIEGGR